MSDVGSLIEERLLRIITEMEGQVELVARSYPPHEMPLLEQFNQMKEYIRCDENGLAYELIVASLEKYPFITSGRSAVGLLEVGLLMQYKTDRADDAIFDRRP